MAFSSAYLVMFRLGVDEQASIKNGEIFRILLVEFRTSRPYPSQ